MIYKREEMLYKIIEKYMHTLENTSFKWSNENLNILSFEKYRK